MNLQHLHVSRSVSKLGANIPSINLPAVITCRQGCACAGKCYARKGHFLFSKVKAKLYNNLELWQTDPETFKQDAAVAAYPAKFFRWHSSGDIPDAEYFQMMVDIAELISGTQFLCFTKKFELVNSYLDNHGVLPENLKIVYSAWGDFIPDNPYNLPMSFVRFRKEPCTIPENALPCSGYCGNCVTTGQSCWDLEKGQSVVFNEH